MKTLKTEAFAPTDFSPTPGANPAEPDENDVQKPAHMSLGQRVAYNVGQKHDQVEVEDRWVLGVVEQVQGDVLRLMLDSGKRVRVPNKGRFVRAVLNADYCASPVSWSKLDGTDLTWGQQLVQQTPVRKFSSNYLYGIWLYLTSLFEARVRRPKILLVPDLPQGMRAVYSGGRRPTYKVVVKTLYTHRLLSAVMMHEVAHQLQEAMFPSELGMNQVHGRHWKQIMHRLHSVTSIPEWSEDNDVTDDTPVGLMSVPTKHAFYYVVLFGHNKGNYLVGYTDDPQERERAEEILEEHAEGSIASIYKVMNAAPIEYLEQPITFTPDNGMLLKKVPAHVGLWIEKHGSQVWTNIEVEEDPGLSDGRFDMRRLRDSVIKRAAKLLDN